MNNFVTKKRIERILREIDRENKCSITYEHREFLKELNLFELFQSSNKIAASKFPSSPSQDTEYKKYRLQLFRESLKEKRLLIGL